MRNLSITLLGFLMTFQVVDDGLSQNIITINGEVEVIENGIVILCNAQTRDTLGKSKIVDHHFNLEIYNLDTAEQALAAIIICQQENKAASAATGIALDNTPLTISIKQDGFSVYSGSIQQHRYTEFLKKVKELEFQLYNPVTGEMIDSIQEKFGKLLESYYRETRNTSFNEFASLISLDILKRKFIRPEHLPTLLQLCKDSIDINKYDQFICEAIYSDSIKWKGKQAPDFSGYRADGEVIQFADVVGSKIIVLDFWASWCGPCIREMPRLKEIYAKGDIEIIGISIDDNQQAWLKSLAQQNLPWINIRDQGKSIANLYNVVAVPTKIIIDKKGIITYWNPDDIQLALSTMK